MGAPKLTRIHLGLGLDEAGVQYEADDGAGGTTTQKGFLSLSKTLTDAVWAEAETKLAEQVALFPPDLPLAEVASALRKKRDAEAAARLAEEEKRSAEAAREAAEQAKAEAERVKTQAEAALAETIAQTGAVLDRKGAAEEAIATLTAQKAALEAEIAAKTAEATKP
jgi:hypothetical protein